MNLFTNWAKFEIKQIKGVIMVPFNGIKLGISILLSCGIIFSFSAYYLIKLPISSLLTPVLLNIGGKFEK